MLRRVPRDPGHMWVDPDFRFVFRIRQWRSLRLSTTAAARDKLTAQILQRRPTVSIKGLKPQVITMTVVPALALVTALAGSSAAQGGEVPPDASIRLQRTSCPGTCPAYTATIDARGTVVYDGERNVRAVGRSTAHIIPASVAKLLATAERMHFFDLRDAYKQIDNPDGTVWVVSDLPTTIITITVNGRTKRVESYVGAPESVAALQREIDEVAGTKRWIFLDEPTLTALLRSGWLASGNEGAGLLHQAIQRDDVPIARTLIEAGADLDGPAENRLPPLGLARSSPMVDLLIRAGANVNERPVGVDRVSAGTPLMTTAHKDAGVAEALLKAGARLEDMEDGRTALWYAACAGNWRVVSVFLNAGANPRGTAGIPAAECARRERQDTLNHRRTVLDRGMPTVEDFDRVIALLQRAEERSKR
jgi:Domain of unknown function (DUF6438)/Ankyrin repeats (3 copies)